MVRRRQAAGGGGGGRRECTTKNKNPTQRCGEKHPWVGTTGAGQNCPERESESPGEDVIFDDWVLVLGSNSLFYFSFSNLIPGRFHHCRSISDMRRGIQGSLVQFTETVCQ